MSKKGGGTSGIGEGMTGVDGGWGEDDSRIGSSDKAEEGSCAGCGLGLGLFSGRDVLRACGCDGGRGTGTVLESN